MAKTIEEVGETIDKPIKQIYWSLIVLTYLLGLTTGFVIVGIIIALK